MQPYRRDASISGHLRSFAFRCAILLACVAVNFEAHAQPALTIDFLGATTMATRDGEST